jgi:hypothetical protein
MVSSKTQSAVECVIGELANMKYTFTGEDVYKRMHNKHIRRGQDYSGCTETPQQVSVEVRKMFNSQNKIFTGYGSTIVPYPSGPVLYFALPHHAKVHIRKIVQAMAQVTGSSGHSLPQQP